MIIPCFISRFYCSFSLLPSEPKAGCVLQEAGECIYDQGGYFIVDGAEKVLITNQQQAFNTLYLKADNRTKGQYLLALSAAYLLTSRKVKRATFYYSAGRRTRFR
jgi:DNA-directed RNA polymerase beta subunit